MAERLTWQGHGRIVNYVKIKDEPEDIDEEEDFFVEFYKKWYNEDLFEIDPSGAIQLDQPITNPKN